MPLNIVTHLLAAYLQLIVPQMPMKIIKIGIILAESLFMIFVTINLLANKKAREKRAFLIYGKNYFLSAMLAVTKDTL